MKTTKKYLKGLLNSIKLMLKLTSLKEEEVAGKFSRKTYLRLFPKTIIRLPFDLGRTMRGCSFTDNLDQDPFSKMVSIVSKSGLAQYIIKFFSKALFNIGI